ncbi:hypothetical protein BN2475_640003 [Paraburkholderia ribeironis]|uniref:Integrase catalytic domain-containing protein n=1 Tax=Paraburkholderia ribeironis TaxID=1247936 RepID=A0A1N7SFS1_9BURK|nr:hypothetical protein BN2475_640003 [Paraburkholderia ribeironis]
MFTQIASACTDYTWRSDWPCGAVVGATALRLSESNWPCRAQCLTIVGVYANGVTLKLIRAGKPTQNADIESFNNELRDDDECLNEHWFTMLAHAPAVITA